SRFDDDVGDAAPIQQGSAPSLGPILGSKHFCKRLCGPLSILVLPDSLSFSDLASRIEPKHTVPARLAHGSNTSVFEMWRDTAHGMILHTAHMSIDLAFYLPFVYNF
ncbi:MAG: hypothetical protein IJI15_01015, partial [Atopobiaceae bacterium]|nr:hypothetical protein [Atopobiaceae bacterium]